jgi:hypothetical protein
MWKNHACSIWATKFPGWLAHLGWLASFERQDSRITDFQRIWLSMKEIRDRLDKYEDVLPTHPVILRAECHPVKQGTQYFGFVFCLLTFFPETSHESRVGKNGYCSTCRFKAPLTNNCGF